MAGEHLVGKGSSPVQKTLQLRHGCRDGDITLGEPIVIIERRGIALAGVAQNGDDRPGFTGSRHLLRQPECGVDAGPRRSAAPVRRAFGEGELVDIEATCFASEFSGLAGAVRTAPPRRSRLGSGAAAQPRHDRSVRRSHGERRRQHEATACRRASSKHVGSLRNADLIARHARIPAPRRSRSDWASCRGACRRAR